MRVCRSPELIAAYHGLPRLRVPRHSPHAFARLTTQLVSSRARAILHLFRVTICPDTGTSNCFRIGIRQSLNAEFRIHDLPLLLLSNSVDAQTTRGCPKVRRLN